MRHNIDYSFLDGSKRNIQYYGSGYMSSDSCESRGLKDMFFAPYESPHEFRYCVDSTLVGTMFLCLLISNPLMSMLLPATFLVGTALSLAIEKISEASGHTSVMHRANAVTTYWGQNLFNLAVSPASTLFFVTRSLSSLIHKLQDASEAGSEADMVNIRAISS